MPLRSLAAPERPFACAAEPGLDLAADPDTASEDTLVGRGTGQPAEGGAGPKTVGGRVVAPIRLMRARCRPDWAGFGLRQAGLVGTRECQDVRWNGDREATAAC